MSEELEFFELEENETNNEEDVDLTPLVVSAFVGIGGYLAGRKLAEFAVNKVRQLYYRKLGIETQLGEVLYPTSIGGKIVFQKITSKDGQLTIEFVEPTKDDWVNIEDDPTEK